MYAKNSRPGQISIEYVAGFVFFLAAILFVVFSVLDKIPPYFDESRSVVMHEAAWIAGEHAVGYAIAGGAAKPAALTNMSRCNSYTSYLPSSPSYINGKSNYTYFKSLFGLDASTEFSMVFKEFAILLPDGFSGANRTGKISIDGNTASAELFNYTPVLPVRFDGIRSGTSYARERQTLRIASIDYLVEKIDNTGKFAIISRTIVNCGRPPTSGKTTAGAKRYTVYNGTIARMEIIVWR